MMNNLFSVFDPSSSLLSLSWSILLISPATIPTILWKKAAPLSALRKKIMHAFSKEVKFTLNKKEKGSEAMIMLAFTTIILLNFLALYPQIFSTTSHLAITLPLSLTFWLTLMLFGWIKNTSHMLSHLLPQGTPGALMAFMVMIELVSNMIRPITLCVRLTANLIAGHLLMSLLGNAMVLLSLPTEIVALPIPILLTVLEAAVACIQAYVFMTLITLYTTEVK